MMTKFHLLEPVYLKKHTEGELKNILKVKHFIKKPILLVAIISLQSKKGRTRNKLLMSMKLQHC